MGKSSDPIANAVAAAGSTVRCRNFSQSIDFQQSLIRVSPVESRILRPWREEIAVEMAQFECWIFVKFEQPEDASALAGATAGLGRNNGSTLIESFLIYVSTQESSDEACRGYSRIWQSSGSRRRFW